ncbi:KR domain-containing protein [Umezawaea tangerina]|uniref:MGT family glycosyltransferase n=1 Tax=Umezawaea tangerina TaxID=84725 RepID=A0A2T0SVJ8_9PSEU|nr:MGT family glycosyltransferase [Umezawaea tangerina]
MSTRRFVWHPRRTPMPDARPSELLAGKRILLIGGTDESVEAVGAALREHGAVLVEPGHLRDADDRPDGVVDLTSDGGIDDDWRPALLRTIGALRGCYDAWAEETDAARTCYVAVTYLGGRMGYRDAGDRPWGGLWAGLAKTLHQELPNLNTKVVDIDPADVDALPGVLLRELYRWGAYEVGYSDGVRYTLAPRREDGVEPTIRLDESDVVLVSGGGRGIGFAAATSLAAAHGCRVVVTGRHPLPGRDEPWSALDDEEFKAHQRDLWIRASADGSLAAVRAETTRMAQRRLLAANLASARAEGLRLDYEVCDFTDRAQVDDLLARLGPALSGVVHNAGVDTATRLPRLSDDDIVRTIATKVDGFVHLFAALRDRPLKFFSNTGSMSGRLGGMVGQIAYAAANDGLTRLGLWADARAGFPVSTLCWPTWERMGLITNYDAAVRYMTAIGAEEGVRRWVDELLAPAHGEVTFLGALGSALNPVQVRGFPLHREVPEFAAVYPRIFHLGTPVSYRPGAELVADVRFDGTSAPVLTDFAVSGEPAVPVGALLENALASAVWVHPAGDEPRVSWIGDVSVCLDGMRLDGGAVELRRTTALSTVDGRPVVDVLFERLGLGPVARLRLGYEPDDDSAAPVAVRAARDSAASAPVRWLGAVIPVATWHEGGPENRTALVREPCPADLWTVPLTPPLALPLAAVENIVRSVLRVRPGPLLRLTRLIPHGPPSATSRIDGDPVRGRWHVVDPTDDRPVLTASTPTSPTHPEDQMASTVDPEAVHREVADILVRVLGDYGVTADSVTRDTDLHTDLQFESIGTDLPVLLGHLGAHYGGRVDLFAYLRGLEMTELVDLKVGSLVDAVVDQLRSAPADVPPTAPPAYPPTTHPAPPSGGDGTAKRFLFVVPPMTGHVNPTIGVAAKLVEQGHQVAWAGYAPLLRPILGPDAVVYDCAVPPAAARWSERGPEVRSMRSIKVMWEELLEPLAHAMVPGVRKAVSDFTPDVVVADQQALAGALVAGAAGLRWATSATTPAELIDMEAGLPKVMDWLAGLFEGLRKEYGGPSTDLRYSPDLVLAYTTEDMVGPVPRPEPIAYVGPSIHPRPAEVDFPWDRLDPHRSLVLVSLGTISVGAGTRFLAEAVAAVRERSARLQAVVVDPTGTTAGDDDVIVLPAVPQLELLGSADVVVCHAGHNTVCEALDHGLPLVVAPIRDDQPIVAAQVEAVGAGIQLRFGLAGARHIGRALDALLDDPSYRREAARIRAAFHAAGGADTAAAHLESYAVRG